MTEMASLAMTAADHRRVGSTPVQILSDNPDKKLHETMDEQQLRSFIAVEVMAFVGQYQRALGGNAREAKTLKSQLENYLAPNIAYLKEIGRLPEELEGFDPQVAFALPEPTGFYYLTGKTSEGKAVESCCEHKDGWYPERLEMERSAFVNATSALEALSVASAHVYRDVWIHHVVIGPRLSGEEIRSLRREQDASIGSR